MSEVAKPEPQPENISGAVEVLELVKAGLEGPAFNCLIQDLISRSEFGLSKYGTRLMVPNGRNNLMDAYQEILDCIVYMRAALHESQLNHKSVKGFEEFILQHIYDQVVAQATSIKVVIKALDDWK